MIPVSAKSEALTGLRALRLPMRRAFRIDLGFDLRTGHCQAVQQRRCQPIDSSDHTLAAAIESGLPLVEEPYAHWARQSGRSEADVLHTIQRWLDSGVLRRFGAVVRHHELGVTANAMTVFNVPDESFIERGQALAKQTRHHPVLRPPARRRLALQPVLHGAWPHRGRNPRPH